MSTNDVDSLIGIYMSHGHGNLAGTGDLHSIGDIRDIEGWGVIGF